MGASERGTSFLVVAITPLAPPRRRPWSNGAAWTCLLQELFKYIDTQRQTLGPHSPQTKHSDEPAEIHVHARVTRLSPDLLVNKRPCWNMVTNLACTASIRENRADVYLFLSQRFLALSVRLEPILTPAVPRNVLGVSTVPASFVSTQHRDVPVFASCRYHMTPWQLLPLQV